MAVRGNETQRASAPHVSAWVSAHAGSGKTTVLVHRILRLLLAGTSPGKILCLTFTRAAAAEMSNRLFARLGAWAAMTDEDLHQELLLIEGKAVSPGAMLTARRLFAQAIETPGGLKIQTIHAFCERLLQQFPFEANVPAHFEVMDDGVAADMRARAVAACLAEAGSMPDGNALAAALDTLVRFTGDGYFQDLIDRLVRRRGELRAWIETGNKLGPALEALRPRLGLADGETLEGIEADILGAALLAQERWPQLIDALRASGKVSDARNADALSAILAAGPDQRRDAYLAFWLTEAGTLRKSMMTRDVRNAHPDLAALVDAEQERLGGLVARLRALEVFDATSALMRLGYDIIDRYTALKLQRGLLDYDDLIISAVSLLTWRAAAPWVLYKLDGGIDHILVDEAQDTSPEQWEVIRALAEEALSGKGAREANRSIFAVGDEKQSIYSFQGADPSAFDQMRRYFERRVRDAEQGWDSVPLIMSYRSVPVVLDAVDKVFARPQANAGLQEVAGPITHAASRAGDPGLIEIWPPVAASPSDDPDPWDVAMENLSSGHPREILARNIARAIGRLCAGETIVQGGRARAIAPGDILILVRRRNDLVDRMIAALKARGIPVAGADRLVLRDHIAVEDLLAAADFTLMPQDDLTLAALLKSPLVGLDEDALFTLAHGRGGSLWAQLEARQAEPVFAQAHDRLAAWRWRADFQRPFAFFARILGAEHGRRKMLARLGPEAGDAIDEFLNLALAYEQTGIPSLQGFVHWFRAQSADIKRNMEEARGEVRILTVHGAKGLEAPVVFLPDTCDVPDRGFAGPLVKLAPASDIEGAPVPLVWAHGKRETAPEPVRAALDDAYAAQLGEYRRLLYVAMTRARDRLYVCGALTGRKKAAEESWYTLINDALEPYCRALPDPDDGAPILRLQGGDLPAVMAGAQLEQARARHDALPLWALEPASAPPRPQRIIRPSGIGGDEVHAMSAGDAGSAGRQAALHKGRLVHALLEHLPGLPASERHGAGARMLGLLAPELDRQERGSILGDALGLFANASLEALFAPGSMAEVPIGGVIGKDRASGELVEISGQIDRLAVTGEAVLVADFKTGRQVPETPGAIPSAYLAQLAAYRVALRPMFPQKPVHALLVWTSGPVVMPVPGALLDAAQQALQLAHG